MGAKPSVEFERHVRELEALGHRGSASALEHRAAEYLAGELRSLGLGPTIEPFRGARSLPSRHLVHVIVAAIGAAVIGWSPVATIVLATAALISLVAEQTTLVVWLSRPVVRFKSQNVWVRIRPSGEAKRRIVLSAHYDTQHCGWVWKINRYLAPLGFRSPMLLKPPMQQVAFLFFAGIILGAAAVVARHSMVIGALAVLLLVGYAVMVLLFVQWALGRSVPGATDNASGVAAVFELARQWMNSPPADDVELVVLLTGCEESGMLGAAAWIDSHRDELRHLPTVYLNIDGIGFGPPRFLGTEVPIVGLPIASRAFIVDLCNQAAGELGLTDAGPHAIPTTDGLAFLERGVPGVTIVGFQGDGVLPHYHTMQDTLANMDLAAAAAGVEFARAVLLRLATSRWPAKTEN
ncbi:MAG TPA: M20/M25/M40 family metallo-hydrolase [Tepidisphaeraceae bacterium]|nr:M20/M25/M40 family metallo-hydrolase [Tepidisphaeraceae bacterium]